MERKKKTRNNNMRASSVALNSFVDQAAILRCFNFDAFGHGFSFSSTSSFASSGAAAIMIASRCSSFALHA